MAEQDIDVKAWESIVIMINSRIYRLNSLRLPFATSRRRGRFGPDDDSTIQQLI
jgi:hypothetical protein